MAKKKTSTDEIKQRLQSLRPRLPRHPYLVVEVFERDRRQLHRAITERFYKRCRKEGVWISNELCILPGLPYRQTYVVLHRLHDGSTPQRTISDAPVQRKICGTGHWVYANIVEDDKLVTSKGRWAPDITFWSCRR